MSMIMSQCVGSILSFIAAERRVTMAERVKIINLNEICVSGIKNCYLSPVIVEVGP